jgi:hypothetical protein
VNVTFSATHTFPDGVHIPGERRMVSQWSSFSSRGEADKRAISVTVEVKHSTTNDSTSVAFKGWCQRVKKDGSDANHPASDVYDASEWLTKAEYYLLCDAIVDEAAKELKDDYIVNEIAGSLQKKADKCTYGEDQE